MTARHSAGLHLRRCGAGRRRSWRRSGSGAGYRNPDRRGWRDLDESGAGECGIGRSPCAVARDPVHGERWTGAGPTAAISATVSERLCPLSAWSDASASRRPRRCGARFRPRLERSPRPAPRERRAPLSSAVLLGLAVAAAAGAGHARAGVRLVAASAALRERASSTSPAAGDRGPRSSRCSRPPAARSARRPSRPPGKPAGAVPRTRRGRGPLRRSNADRARCRHHRTRRLAGSGGGLTRREVDVLRLLVEGRPDEEIADVLFVSRRTVPPHVTAILTKLGVASRAAAAADGGPARARLSLPTPSALAAIARQWWPRAALPEVEPTCFPPPMVNRHHVHADHSTVRWSPVTAALGDTVSEPMGAGRAVATQSPRSDADPRLGDCRPIRCGRGALGPPPSWPIRDLVSPAGFGDASGEMSSQPRAAADPDHLPRADADPDRAPALLSAREAAGELALDERTIRRAIRRGDLEATKLGRSFQISRAALARYRTRLAPPPPRRPPHLITASAADTFPPVPAPVVLPPPAPDRPPVPHPPTPFVGRGARSGGAGGAAPRRSGPAA